MSAYEWPQAPGADAVAPKGDDSAGRRAFNAERRQGLGGPENMLALRAAAQVQRAAAAAPAGRLRAMPNGANLLWQPLGPQALLGGQAEGRPRVSGRVNALAVHPGGLRAYAASANGGVWATTDGGANWVSVAGLASTNTAGITRPAQRNACGAIHVRWPKNPGDPEVVFLGTGEVGNPPAGRPGDPEGGLGVFVAEDPLTSFLEDPWRREAINLLGDGVYRLASNTDGSLVVAATRNGLFQRSLPAATDSVWEPVRGGPFTTAAAPFTARGVRCTDVLFTPAHGGPGGRPERLWVWVQDGPGFGLWVRDAGYDIFRFVAVDLVNSPSDYVSGRAVLAAGVEPTKVWLLLDSGTPPSLFRINNPATPVAVAPLPPQPALTALGVANVPDVLRSSGWYNIALAVHPTQQDLVVVAGSYLGDPNVAADRPLVTTRDGARRGFDGSIVADTVVADPNNAAGLVFGTQTAAQQMLGIGVHPDVHELVFSNAGNTLWTGCDGGVYRSDRLTSSAGFYARQQGLSISESNYLGANPVFEGEMMAGLQDNGTVQRRSGGTWQVALVGDGGSVLMDPLAPERWLAQYTRGVWSAPGSSWAAGPVFRKGAPPAESGFAAFYSSAAVVRHQRGVLPVAVKPTAQFLVGTHRLWYTDTFGKRWVTLPTGTDPLPAQYPNPATPGAPVVNVVQDTLGEAVHMCRWQDPDTAWVLSSTQVWRFARVPGSHNGTLAGTWAPLQVLLSATVPAPPLAPAPDPLASLRNAVAWTEIEPNLLPPQGAQPALSALYLGTVGAPADPASDTLWWFDGVSAWWPTALRAKVPAPVTAIAVDPQLPAEVWVGTSVGVLHGVRRFEAAPAPGAWKWDWSERLNGLPEAAVEDLSFFLSGAPDNLRLLRAAIASRGVWELRLDQPVVPTESYLRVHAGDLRHRANARLLKADGVTLRPWHASPDIRPRLLPAATLPAPASLPWQRGSGKIVPALLRRFQAALRKSSNDPRVAVTGVWDAYFSEVLRDLGFPAVNLGAAPNKERVRLTKAFWDTHAGVAANVLADPWGSATPTEADLYDMLPDLPEGGPKEPACRLASKPWRVEVVVHHRGRNSRRGADLKVTLLWWTDTAKPRTAVFNRPDTWAPGNVPWDADVQAMLDSPGGASAALSGGWNYAGSTDATRRLSPSGELDPLNPGVVSFDLNPGSLPKDSVVLLVAVVRAAGDPPINPLPLQALTLGNRCVAVRAVRIT